MSDYQPIDCALYERYEIAILHRHPLRVRWRDAGGLVHLETLEPKDLETRDGEEFLLARSPDGTPRRLRLDAILNAEPAQ